MRKVSISDQYHYCAIHHSDFIGSIIRGGKEDREKFFADGRIVRIFRRYLNDANDFLETQS